MVITKMLLSTYFWEGEFNNQSLTGTMAEENISQMNPLVQKKVICGGISDVEGTSCLSWFCTMVRLKSNKVAMTFPQQTKIRECIELEYFENVFSHI